MSGAALSTSQFSLENYTPPGPVGAGFIKALGPIDIIMGPAGSGKTVASSYKGPWIASSFMPVCKDGVIRVRQATIRDTYRDLARTCLASWHEIFPPDSPFTESYEGGQDRPVRHRLKWKTLRNGQSVVVEFDMQFGAIGDANIESFIKGYEVSLGWGNECDLLDERVLPLLLQRTGRYPKIADIAESELARVRHFARDQYAQMGITLTDDDTPLPRMVWGDCNPPDIESYVYKNCVDEPRPGWTLHKQPSGLSSQAENRAGKPRASYELEARTMNEYDVRRYVHGDFGYALDGAPVYPEFNMDANRADEPIDPVKGLPLSLGFDFGGTPACIICQFMPNGQMRALREITSDPGTGPERFSANVLEVLLADFAGFPIGEAWGDPSGAFGGDKIQGTPADMEIIGKALNIALLPTETNDPSTRRAAFRWYLGAPIDGKTPRFLVDPRCKLIVGGLAAHFKLTKQSSASATDNAQVVKNKHSHPCEALEYAALGHRGQTAVIRDATRMGRAGNVVPIKSVTARSDFDVFSV